MALWNRSSSCKEHINTIGNRPYRQQTIYSYMYTAHSYHEGCSVIAPVRRRSPFVISAALGLRLKKVQKISWIDNNKHYLMVCKHSLQVAGLLAFPEDRCWTHSILQRNAGMSGTDMASNLFTARASPDPACMFEEQPKFCVHEIRIRFTEM